MWGRFIAAALRYVCRSARFTWLIAITGSVLLPNIAIAQTFVDPGYEGWKGFGVVIAGDSPEPWGRWFCAGAGYPFQYASTDNYPTQNGCIAQVVCVNGPSVTIAKNLNPCPNDSILIGSGIHACTCLLTKPPKLIVVDPGHGGTKCAEGGTETGGDTGTTGPTYKDTEHGLALKIGLSLRDKLTAKGYKVIMTRTEPVCPSPAARATLANTVKADLFVSIHFNGADPAAHGTEVYGKPAVPLSWQLATTASAMVSSKLGTVDRGPRTANLAVLRIAKMPAVLVEVAFLTNVRGDEDIMHRASAPDDAASGLFTAIDNVLK